MRKNKYNEKEGEIKIKQIKPSTNPISGKTYALILTIVILIIGTFFYFTALNNFTDTSNKSEKSMDANKLEKQMTSENNADQVKTSDNSVSTETNVQNSNSLFNHLLQENRIFTKKDANGYIELFYYYSPDEPIDIQLKEGNIKEYKIHTIAGQNYYPLILGSEEAKRMRAEGDFNNIGDPIKNFYGKNVVVVGVMNRLDNVFDTIHIVPLNSGELN